MKRYRINPINHMIVIHHAFILPALFLATLYWFEFDTSLSIIFGIVFLIDFLPALYLHLQYWHKNRGEEYAVTENEIIRYTNGQEEVFKAEDIEHCIVYRSASIDKGSWITFFSMEEYYYARLLLRSGGELIITCLLMPKMDQILGRMEGIPSERKKRGFNTLRWR